MLAVNNAPERAQWEVLWIKDRKVQRKHCGHDLMEALRVYRLVEQAGRSGVTLRCCNMGFPPPEKFLPRKVKAKRRLNPPVVVKVGGKRYRKHYEIVDALKVPMKEKNAKGIWWCPYCQKFRRFVKSNHVQVDSVKVPDRAYVCPMCRVPHRDANVRKWNPIAVQLFYELAQQGHRSPPRDRKASYRKRRRRRQANGE